jgi:hypothetical protein
MFYTTEGNDSKNTINIKYFIKDRWDWTRMHNIPLREIEKTMLKLTE